MQVENSTDQKLFEGLKKGDKKSIEMIYSQIFPSVKNWIINNTGSVDDAYDVFQESLEIILLKVKNLESSLSALLMTISKRRWLDKLKKRKTKQRYTERQSQSIQSPSTEDGYIREETEYEKFKLLEQTFEQLTELCQKIMSMIKAGEDVSNIVSILKLNSANTLYRRKAACIEKWSTLVRSSPIYKELSYE